MSQGGSTNLTECYDERDKCNVINQLASQGHIIQAIGYSNESMICDIYSITHDCDPSLSSFVIVSLWQSQIQNIKDLGLKFCLVKGMQYCWLTLSMSEFAGANCNGVWGSDSLSCPDWPATTPLPPLASPSPPGTSHLTQQHGEEYIWHDIILTIRGAKLSMIHWQGRNTATRVTICPGGAHCTNDPSGVRYKHVRTFDKKFAVHIYWFWRASEVIFCTSGSAK